MGVEILGKARVALVEGDALQSTDAAPAAVAV